MGKQGKIADGVGWVADKAGEQASAVIRDPAKILPWNW